MGFFIFSTTLYKTFLILRIQRDIITDVHRFSCKVAITIVRLYLITRFFFPDRFLHNPHIRNFMKIRPMVAELFHSDGQT